MEFLVLGSGTALPDPDRGPAGFAVHAGGHTWLVDGGTGTLQRAARFGVDPRALTGGLYSHRHPDHCADLAPLLFSMCIPPRRQGPYRIVAGEGMAEHVAALQAIWSTRWITPGDGELIIDEVSLEEFATVDLPGITLTTAPANHSMGAVHLRIEADGAAVVFSGDTGPSSNLVTLARGADLLVTECAAPDESPIDGHLTPSDILALVEDARPAEIWLTHFYPGVDEATALSTVGRAGLPVRRAQDGDRWFSAGSAP